MSAEWDCPKCHGDEFESRVVDEVGGVAVGPYTIEECCHCGYEHVNFD
jgi:predicted nucleic-acid-binding Zn-ribbon protein